LEDPGEGLVDLEVATSLHGGDADGYGIEHDRQGGFSPLESLLGLEAALDLPGQLLILVAILPQEQDQGQAEKAT